MGARQNISRPGVFFLGFSIVVMLLLLPAGAKSGEISDGKANCKLYQYTEFFVDAFHAENLTTVKESSLVWLNIRMAESTCTAETCVTEGGQSYPCTLYNNDEAYCSRCCIG